MQSTTETTPRVWIGDLAAYNAGHLHGEWVDATDAEELHEAGRRIIASSPADFPEELFIADHEGFGDLIGEYTPLDTVAEIGAALEEHGDGLRYYAENIGERYFAEDVDAAVEGYEEALCGSGYDSLRDYAEQQAEEWLGMTREESERFGPYIDIDKIEADLDGDGYWERGGYIFRPV